MLIKGESATFCFSSRSVFSLSEEHPDTGILYGYEFSNTPRILLLPASSAGAAVSLGRWD